MGKKLILSEAQLKNITKTLLMEDVGLKKVSKPYTISPDKVLVVKRYLDNSFKKGSYENIGADGFPKKERIVAMLASNGDILKNMYLEQVKDLLVDKFQKMFTDEEERDLFMARVLDDWFNDKISPFGILPINHLNESISDDFIADYEDNINDGIFNILSECAKISGAGKLNESAKEFTTSNIGAEAKKVNTNPTDGQKQAGNYKKGHIVVRGMKITIEQPKGSYRKGKDANGREWKQLMHNHYGYFTRTKGKDGDEVDVFLGPRLKSFTTVFVIDQNNGSREFDESKVMLGFDSEDKAKDAYLSNYKKGWNRIRKITGVPLKIFKEWLYRGRKQRQPFGDYVTIKQKKLNENKKDTLDVPFNVGGHPSVDFSQYIEHSMRDNKLKNLENEPAFDGWKRVSHFGKMNLANAETGKLLTDKWFDWISYMVYGTAIVRADDKRYNWIREDGTLVSPEWFDDVSEFGEDGKAFAKNGNIYYIVYGDGKVEKCSIMPPDKRAERLR